MVDLVDKGEAELQQLTQKVTMTTSSASMKASLWVGKGVAAAPFKAVTAIYRSIQKNVNKQRESGQVSLKDFSKIAEGKRDLVNIDDRAVSKELERELRRHGVVWSVETHRDGSRTFHVQGKDAELIQHALTVAAERVTTQPDEAVTDRGGHSIEREPALTRSEQRPEQTARDRTRAHAAEKIDKDVKQRKAEIDSSKTRTKKRTPSRNASDDAPTPKANRR